MKKTLWALVIIIIIAGAAYFFLNSPKAQAPAPASTTTVQTQSNAPTSNTVQKPPANVGASGVYDPNARKGSAAECAQCNQYSGAQKGQCLAALNC
jgi:hypothetical protein